MENKVYKLQWAYVNDENGKPIPATDYNYKDFNNTPNSLGVTVYHSYYEAEKDRILLLHIYNDRYFRVCEF